MKVSATQTYIVIHKGCPPKSIKILAAQIQGHSKSIIGGHAELFEEINKQYKLIMSAQRLQNIDLLELANYLYKLVKSRKHYVKLIIRQTEIGGVMQYDYFHTPNSYRNLLLGY